MEDYNFLTPEQIALLPPRERILEVASCLFYEKGIHAVGVDVIASQANTNKMTLYRHYKSKDDLIAAYLRHLSNTAFLIWNDLEKEHPNDALGQLKAWIQMTAPDHNEPCGNRGCALMNAVAELPNKDHPGRIVIDETKKKFYKMIQDLCRRANLKEPDQLADELLLLYEGATACFQSLGPKGPCACYTTAALYLIDAHKK